MANRGKVVAAIGGGLALAGLGLAFASRGRARGGEASAERVEEIEALCATSADAIVERVRARTLTRGQARAWLDCDGRTPEQAIQLLDALMEADPELAREMRAYWNARRAVEREEPDGRLEDAEAAAVAEETPPPTPEPEPPPPAHRDAAERGEVRGGVTSGLPERVAPESSVEGLWNPASSPTYDPREARDRAGPLSRTLARGRRTAYQEELRAFQAAAGLEVVDGLYGPKTYQALRYYGIARPPRPFVQTRRAESPDARYAPRPVRVS